eukprot:jgi/Tetstr1/447289/TSEL_034726.t1
MQAISVGSTGAVDTFRVSQEDVNASVQLATGVADNVNKIIADNGGLLGAFNADLVDISLHEPQCYPGSARGEMRPWFHEATNQLFEIMSSDPRREWFKAGSLGSIWFDTELTGAGKTKLTRVTVAPAKRDGRHHIVLDATFDEMF